MKWDLAKLMHEALERNKDIFKKSSNDLKSQFELNPYLMQMYEEFYREPNAWRSEASTIKEYFFADEGGTIKKSRIDELDIFLSLLIENKVAIDLAENKILDSGISEEGGKHGIVFSNDWLKRNVDRHGINFIARLINAAENIPYKDKFNIFSADDIANAHSFCMIIFGNAALSCFYNPYGSSYSDNIYDFTFNNFYSCFIKKINNSIRKNLLNMLIFLFQNSQDVSYYYKEYFYDNIKPNFKFTPQMFYNLSVDTGNELTSEEIEEFFANYAEPDPFDEDYTRMGNLAGKMYHRFYLSTYYDELSQFKERLSNLDNYNSTNIDITTWELHPKFIEMCTIYFDAFNLMLKNFKSRNSNLDFTVGR